MSEFVHRIAKDPLTSSAGAPSQDYSNAGSGQMNQSLTVNNAALIAVAATSGKQIVSTLYGATIDQIGNAQLEETLGKVSKVAGYIGLAFVNPYLALGKVGTDLITNGISRAIEIQDTQFENEMKKATSGVNTSLGGNYG